MKISKLMEALAIMKMYGNPQFDVNPHEGALTIYLDPKDVSEEDNEKLNNLGFTMGADGQSYEL